MAPTPADVPSAPSPRAVRQGSLPARVVRTIQGWLDRTSPEFLWMVALALVAFIGWIDYLTGPDITMSFFYLVPVSLAGWFLGRRISVVLVSVICTIVNLWADVAWGRYESRSLIPYWNAGSRLALFGFVALLLPALRRALEHERDLARTDPLTGVANARQFYEIADLELSRAQRYGRALSLAYLDIDDFKLVNDDLGHNAGDELLRQVASCLRRGTRSLDTVARLGGDEFVVLFPETESESARTVLERVRGDLVRTTKASHPQATFSIGAVTFLELPGSVGSLIRTADGFMYEVKRAGKDGMALRTIGERGPEAEDVPSDGERAPDQEAYSVSGARLRRW
jgi:diguanylate cyclase (GGDEF)-like protein